MGSPGTIPESHARPAGQKQLTAWSKEGLIEHRRGSRTRRRRAEKLYALTPKGENRIMPPRRF